MKARPVFGAGRALLLCALCAACGVQGSVTRVADGSREEGRYIDSVAYSAYAQAALLEAAGDLHGALRAYHAALASDDDSPEILTRIAALDCRLAQAGDRKAASAALAAFDRALEHDATYAASYAERAACLEA
ncbi:MAG TPA: hypothetical protein VGP93_08870, partial [Polyangiaceae bacterium]|nr:hypothetical protein [Polyangiaceae bacterium]